MNKLYKRNHNFFWVNKKKDDQCGFNPSPKTCWFGFSPTRPPNVGGITNF